MTDHSRAGPPVFVSDESGRRGSLRPTMSCARPWRRAGSPRPASSTCGVRSSRGPVPVPPSFSPGDRVSCSRSARTGCVSGSVLAALRVRGSVPARRGSARSARCWRGLPQLPLARAIAVPRLPPRLRACARSKRCTCAAGRRAPPPTPSSPPPCGSSREVAGVVVGRASARPDLRELATHLTESLTGSDLVRLAERNLHAPLDARSPCLPHRRAHSQNGFRLVTADLARLALDMLFRVPRCARHDPTPRRAL